MNPNPKSPQKSQNSGQAVNQPPARNGRKPSIKIILRNIWKPVDEIGKAVLGDLWRTLYLTLQDAIALALILKIPDALGALIIGEQFSSLKVCLKYDLFNPTRFACSVIVLSNYLLWILMAARILGRFWADLRNSSNNNK